MKLTRTCFIWTHGAAWLLAYLNTNGETRTDNAPEVSCTWKISVLPFPVPSLSAKFIFTHMGGGGRKGIVKNFYWKLIILVWLVKQRLHAFLIFSTGCWNSPTYHKSGFRIRTGPRSPSSSWKAPKSPKNKTGAFFHYKTYDDVFFHESYWKLTS